MSKSINSEPFYDTESPNWEDPNTGYIQAGSLVLQAVGAVALRVGQKIASIVKN